MKKAQSMLEYTILVMIIIAAFMTMQVYVKRGIQGRWKQSVDDMGEQYDVNHFGSNLTQQLQSTSESRSWIMPGRDGGTNGAYTFRQDSSSATETKTRDSAIDSGSM